MRPIKDNLVVLNNKMPIGIKLMLFPYLISVFLNHRVNKFFYRDFVVETVTGTKFFCRKNNNSDFGMTHPFFEQECFAKINEKQYKSFVDIGANLGRYSIEQGKKYGDKIKIIAIEPEPTIFKMLETNIKLNDLNNITPIQVGLADKEGSMNLFIGKHQEQHTFLKNTDSSDDSISVKVKTLDNVCKELNFTPDLLKIDVEGFEISVLNGAQKTLKTAHPDILFEAFTQEHLNNISNILTPHGYKISVINSYNYFATCK